LHEKDIGRIKRRVVQECHASTPDHAVCKMWGVSRLESRLERAGTGFPTYLLPGVKNIKTIKATGSCASVSDRQILETLPLY